MNRRPELEQAVLDACRARSLARTVYWFDQVESTQDTALGLIRTGAVPDGTLVVADTQLHGRGREGARWHSPPGAGVWASLVLYPRTPVGRTPELTLLAARALREMLEFDFCLPAIIKPPNDILLGGKKLAGILAESSSTAGQPALEYMILGFGINRTTRFPPELEPIGTRLSDHLGDVPGAPDILARFLERFEPLYRAFEA